MRKPCTQAISELQNLGAEITFQYDNVGAIAATISKARLTAVSALTEAKVVYKDVMINAPKPVEGRGVLSGKGVGVILLEAQGVKILEGEDLDGFVANRPNNYNFNNNLTGAAALHTSGVTGNGVIVAIIDSGTANNPRLVPALAGSVLGGENFVPGLSEPSATSTLNDSHGTWVGSMIAAHANFLFLNTSPLIRSLMIHSPESVIPCMAGDCPLNTSITPMIGTAPDSSIYALKVFSALGGDAPKSRIIAAMDRAITLRRNFNNGMPSIPVSGDGSENDPFVFDSLNIEVVNMSLGGHTLFAGRDLEDQFTRAMLDVGITIVASAGNDGHAAMTGNSPGTGIGTLTAGAASSVAHERVLRDLQGGLGFGSLFRPSDHHQMATFSSRGPTADGRIDPDVVANGVGSFVQGADGILSFVSGTSFASPTIAGAAALLREAFPSALASQIRKALIDTANPAVLGDGSGEIDQGGGFIDIPAALTLLQLGKASSGISEGKPGKNVRGNVGNLGFSPINFDGDRFSTRIPDLLPGQVAHFFIRSRSDTEKLTIALTNIVPDLPLNEQNIFFGDDIFLVFQDAQTSFDKKLVSEFLNDDMVFVVDNPQTGLLRVAVMGDWTNAGRVSADLVIEQTRKNQSDEIAKGKIAQGEVVAVPVEVPFGTTQSVFELSWDQAWGIYPTNDIDLILIDPLGGIIFDGATLNSPERVVIETPADGIWTALISGFTVHGKNDQFELGATLD